MAATFLAAAAMVGGLVPVAQADTSPVAPGPVVNAQESQRGTDAGILAGAWDYYYLQVVDTNGLRVQFARGGDNALWHRWQTCSSCDFGDWVSLGGQMQGSPAAVAKSDGVLVAYVTGTDNQLWHKWQFCDGCGWSEWSPLAGHLTSNPWAVVQSDGKMVAFARGPGDAIWHKWQFCNGCGWSEWSSLDGPSATYPVAGTFSPVDDRLWVQVQRVNGGPTWQRQQLFVGGAWTGWFQV